MIIFIIYYIYCLYKIYKYIIYIICNIICTHDILYILYNNNIIHNNNLIYNNVITIIYYMFSIYALNRNASSLSFFILFLEIDETVLLLKLSSIFN